MNKTLKLTVAAMLLLLVASCDHSIYSGFKKMESGAYMKFYVRSDSGQMPRIGDGVTLEMSQYFNDTLLFTTAGDNPLDLIVKESSFVGDVPDAIRMMHVGDSARLVVLADSVFITTMQREAPEEYAGKPIYYDLKLLDIKPFEEIEAQRQSVLDSLRIAEQEYLVGLQSDTKNTVTESGLIIMEKKGKGKLAKLGDYLEFDLTLCNKDNDTMVHTFGDDPVEMQYGADFLGEGMDEVLGMVPEGGLMHVVIPSALAFDSVGYQRMLLPYAPLVVTIKMNAVMDKETYEKKQAAIEAEKQAEKERKLALEKSRIAEYIAANGITETPTESGLYIISREEGKGNLAKWGDEVAVHYVLKNLNGDTVESSYIYEQPLEFMIGQNEMIPAIEEALMTMAPGAKATVITPSELAFGEMAIDEEILPAYSPMVIELELVYIK